MRVLGGGNDDTIWFGLSRSARKKLDAARKPAGRERADDDSSALCGRNGTGATMRQHSRYLGVLLVLFTALTAGTVLALTWPLSSAPATDRAATRAAERSPHSRGETETGDAETGGTESGDTEGAHAEAGDTRRGASDHRSAASHSALRAARRVAPARNDQPDTDHRS